MDYEPVDLEQYANEYDDVELAGVHPWRGKEILRGIPFIFAEDRGQTRVVRLAPNRNIRIPVLSDIPCKTITFAHRVQEPNVQEPNGDGFSAGGLDDAAYIFTYSGGVTCRVAIRRGFEIALPWLGRGDLRWEGLPSLAVPDQEDTLPDRTYGSFADVGSRQTEVVAAGTWSSGCYAGVGLGGWQFYLWSWINPHPERRVVRIDLEARGAIVDVGALSLGFVDEHPLRPEPARAVVADLPPDYVGDVTDLAIEVDRGSVSYTVALVQGPSDNDPLSTWGDKPHAEIRSVYARVSALPSGTVRLVGHDDKSLSEAPWADLRRRGSASAGSLRVTELGRNWVRVKIVDDTTGELMPCRLNFSSPDGVPYQPHGHHHHVNSNLSSWHIDVGSDVRLGRTTYAYVNGSCEGWLPRGPVRVQVARGFDYRPIDESVQIDDNTRELTLRASRLHDPSKDGWYSGDTHVHFVSSFGGLREAAAEGLSVVHLLQSQWGSLFTNTGDFVGYPLSSEDGKTILYTSQENRQHFLGHLSLLGLKKPVMPWCTDGPSESEMGDGVEATLADWADRCRAQGGTVVVPHFPDPNGEVAALIATKRVDALESLAVGQERMSSEYYRYLNAGYRIPLAGGTDKMSNDVPVGLSRTYVRLEAHQDFGFDAWCDALKAGRSYMSSGPLLDFAIDGASIGDTVYLSDRGGTVTVRASAKSIFPMYRMELIYLGRVIASSESILGAYELRIDEEVRIDGPGWMCIRVGGNGPVHLTQHRDEWQRAIMAHSSPVYIACGARQHVADRAALEYTMGLVDRGRSYVTSLASLDARRDVLHHHDSTHREFLLKPFDEAREALERRLHLANDQ